MADLENRVEQETVTKDIITAFPYFGSALAETKNMGKEEAYQYVSSTLELISKKVKDNETKFLMEGLEDIADHDYRTNGTLTNSTYQFFESYTGLYSIKAEKAPLKELAASAKELGFSGKMPEFICQYSDESLDSLKAKYKETIISDKNGKITEIKDEKLKLVYGAFMNTLGIISTKADSNVREFIAEKNFNAMQEEYNKIIKKEGEK